MNTKQTTLSHHQFQPTVTSLLNYQCPDWFRDAKFGIYLHWGVYSVPEQGEWYPRQMYIEGHPCYQHHCATYGHPSQFGCKDLIDNYHPDFLYFDGCIPFAGEDNGQTGMEVIAHLYNHSMARHDGRQL